MRRTFLLMLVVFGLLVVPLHSEEMELAHLGDFKLENGEIIRDCVVGYRTFGQINPDKTNAVLFPTALWVED